MCGSLQCQRGGRTPVLPGLEKYTRMNIAKDSTEYECKSVSFREEYASPFRIYSLRSFVLSGLSSFILWQQLTSTSLSTILVLITIAADFILAFLVGENSRPLPYKFVTLFKTAHSKSDYC